MLVSGLVAGGVPPTSSRSRLRAPAALLAAAAVVLVGHLGSAVLAEGGVEPGDDLWRLVTTVAVGGLLLPPLLALDRALVRRRLG
jgi:rod shape-determining protein MreD